MSTVQSADSQRLQRLSIQAMRAYVESGLRGVEAEVVLALDVSRFMGALYASGAVQELTESLVALGMCFDDDLTIPTWAFADDATRVGELTHEHYSDWVSDVVVPSAAKLEMGCRYAPVINDIGRRYFPEEWGTLPEEQKVGGKLKRTVKIFPPLRDPRPYALFVIVITAGDCADPSETIRALRRASHVPIFWQFAGLSPAGMPHPPFEFLKRIDRLTDRHVDNCGFFEPRDFRDAKSMFEGLLNEFPAYLQLPKVKAMLLPPRDLTKTGSVEHDDVDALLLAMPPDVAARKERERAARARRRMARAAAVQEAAGQDGAAPAEGASATETQSEVNLTRSKIPRLVANAKDTAPRGAQRKKSGTRPYRVGNGPPTVAGPEPPAPTQGRPRPPITPPITADAVKLPKRAEKDEDPTKRLARIRARRAARRAKAGVEDPTV